MDQENRGKLKIEKAPVASEASNLKIEIKKIELKIFKFQPFLMNGVQAGAAGLLERRS